MLWKAIDQKGDLIHPTPRQAFRCSIQTHLLRNLLNPAAGQESKNRQYLQDHLVTVPLIDQSISEKKIIKHIIKKQGKHIKGV